jgi:HD-like signal output (HDOD) protein
MHLDQAYLDRLIDDLRDHRLALPAMPEVALKAGKYASQDSSMNSAELARLLAADAILAGRLLQIANSPFFRGLNPVENIQTAISRLGAICVRNLVMSLVIGQAFQQAGMHRIRKPLRQVWLHSTNVAAHSYVIARLATRLSPHEAMLGGLVHNIGMLPLLIQASQQPELLNDLEAYIDAAEIVHPSIGQVVLELWAFPEALAKAVAEHDDLNRVVEKGPDLGDVVQVANLHCRVGTPHRLAKVKWNTVPAFERLDLSPERSIQALREARTEIQALQRLLRE